jgi:pseudoazurin
MNYSRLFLILISFILSVGFSEADKAIEKRIAPVGSVCVQGEDCGSASAPVAAPSSSSLPKIALSEGSEHTVKMLNSGPGGTMVFDPPVIKVSVGDTIHFKSVDLSHNSASIAGMIPEGASSWAGMLSQDISVTLEKEGVYVYQCDPHVMMAMVGVIQAGEATNLESIKAAVAAKKSTFIMNADRLDNYLSQL